jgi:hypothetical protein
MNEETVVVEGVRQPSLELSAQARRILEDAWPLEVASSNPVIHPNFERRETADHGGQRPQLSSI